MVLLRQLVKEQTGIITITIHGGLREREMVLIRIPVTQEQLDATLVVYAGILAVVLVAIDVALQQV